MRNDILKILEGRVDESEIDDIVDRIVTLFSKEEKRRGPNDAKIKLALSDAESLEYVNYDYKLLWLDWIKYKAISKRDFYSSADTQQKSLNILMRYDIRFANDLIENAIAAGHKGFHYANTPSQYEYWKKSALASIGISAKEARYATALTSINQQG